MLCISSFEILFYLILLMIQTMKSKSTSYQGSSSAWLDPDSSFDFAKVIFTLSISQQRSYQSFQYSKIWLLVPAMNPLTSRKLRLFNVTKGYKRFMMPAKGGETISTHEKTNEAILWVESCLELKMILFSCRMYE